MNKFKYYFLLLLAGIAIVSCNKSDDDDVVVVPLRDYTVQYKADNDSIVKYLKTNYIKEVTTDFNVVIEKIPAGGTQKSIWDQQDYPLQNRVVYNRDVNYTVYFLTFRKGTGEAPCNFDTISVGYTGNLLNGTVFDTSYNVARTLNLDIYSVQPTIDGWGEILPQFKTGTAVTGANGVVTYDNYGVGMMFLPSGLAYYANAQGDIPAYTPIAFTFKLFQLRRVDSEFNSTTAGNITVGDGIPTYLEDLNGDGYLYNNKDTERYPNLPADLIDDSDGDGIPDFLDHDDDGDGYSTRFELTKPAGAPNTGLSLYYPYNPVLDNPDTPNVDETETWAIPRRPTGELTDPTKPESITNPRKFIPEDYTAAGRLRIYLDKTYPYQKN